jgi:hypothetical protein
MDPSSLPDFYLPPSFLPELFNSDQNFGNVQATTDEQLEGEFNINDYLNAFDSVPSTPSPPVGVGGEESSPLPTVSSPPAAAPSSSSEVEKKQEEPSAEQGQNKRKIKELPKSSGTNAKRSRAGETKTNQALQEMRIKLESLISFYQQCLPSSEIPSIGKSALPEDLAKIIPEIFEKIMQNEISQIEAAQDRESQLKDRIKRLEAENQYLKTALEMMGVLYPVLHRR